MSEEIKEVKEVKEIKEVKEKGKRGGKTNLYPKKNARDIARKNTPQLGYHTHIIPSKLANTKRGLSENISYEENYLIDPIDYILTPSICTCGKLIDDEEIEVYIRDGLSIKDAIAKTDNIRICCIRTITTSPYIVNIQIKTFNEKTRLQYLANTQESEITPIISTSFNPSLTPIKMPNQNIQTILTGPTDLKLVIDNDGFYTCEGVQTTNVSCSFPQYTNEELELEQKKQREMSISKNYVSSYGNVVLERGDYDLNENENEY